MISVRHWFQLQSEVMKQMGKSFSSHRVENHISQFPGIKTQQNVQDSPRKVTDYHYCRSHPKPRNKPQLAGLSASALELLGYDYEAVAMDQETPFYLSGSKLIPGSMPICHNYCGHQFGVWAGQLGDGRAHTLGTLNPSGKIYELQLKGSGMSPFSRHADGNSVVSSAVREFLVSELMAGLQIPTTRAASLVIADEQVIRDPMYNGVIKKENAAIILRLAPSFLRFGSFQVCNQNAQMDTGDWMQNRQVLQPLARSLCSNFYTEIDEQECDIYQELYKQLLIRSARLVAKWQCVGFVHGVLNTDNLSMMGVTIDYGPFGFIDYFSKDYVSNATDEYQRYSYRRQAETVKWNLEKLAESFDPLVPVSVLKKHLQELYFKNYQKEYDKLMADKLGLSDNPQSKQLVAELLDLMHTCGSNYTNTFRTLSQTGLQRKEMIQLLLLESQPKSFYLQSLRVFEFETSRQQIEQIESRDSGFNTHFLNQQAKRMQLREMLSKESCHQRTQRQTQLWHNWLDKYEAQHPNRNLQSGNTVRYVLLNETAKLITEQLVAMQPLQQRQLISRILRVFEDPFRYDQWFEHKYWTKKPVPVRLTCSS